MRFNISHTLFVCTVLLLCALQCEFAVSYKTEIEITPAPPEEQTTKKSGWFSRLFGGDKTTTTTTTPFPPRNVPAPTPSQPQPNAPRVQPNTAGVQKPPPLAINPNAPLMPLGPRPDTPESSPFGGNGLQPPQWPQPTPQSSAQTPTTPTGFRPPAGSPQLQPQQRPQAAPTATNFNGVSNVNNFGRPGTAQPNYPPGFAPYQPPRAQPSGLDLSYGGGVRPQGGTAGRPGFGLAPLTSTTTTSSTTTTTTTTPKPGPPGSALGLDMRSGFGGFDVPSTTTTRRPSTTKDDFLPLPPRRPSVDNKEDFPPLPTPRTPGSPTPASPLRPSSPGGGAQPTPNFAWGTPTPAAPARPGIGIITPASPTPNSPTRPGTPGAGGSGVSFVPHVPGPSTTAKPGAGSSASASLASDDEIRALTEQLFTKEQGLLNLVHVNPQGKTRSIDSTDEAPKPLFEVEPRAYDSPTVAKMRALFDNYEEDTLANEHVTVNERREENEFVDAVMGTQVMRQAMLFLQNKGIVTPDPKTHRDLVKELWFTQYSRGQGRIGSSGFEHVFVHEVKNGTLIGLHNWVYFADEEKAGRLDYKGYLHQIDLGNKAKVLKVRFSHKGVNKPVNGVFAGTSPELEMALYTVCFQLRPDRTCPVSLGNQRFGIVTYTWRYRGKHLIGSAFPEI